MEIFITKYRILLANIEIFITKYGKKNIQKFITKI
jgi:hypothetical protein